MGISKAACVDPVSALQLHAAALAEDSDLLPMGASGSFSVLQLPAIHSVLNNICTGEVDTVSFLLCT